jgi:magnesium transporter
VTWVSVEGLGDAAMIKKLGAHLNLHPLALEDVVNVHQRPKVDNYGDQLFVVMRADGSDEGFDTRQIGMFLGKRYVVSFQESRIHGFTEVARRLEQNEPQLRGSGADYLLYCLIDAVIDDYFPLLEDYGDRLDALDNEVSTKPRKNIVAEVHSLRQELLAVRRAVWPIRDAINTLLRDHSDKICNETRFYFRDCYDHAIQLIDVIETDREMCNGARDYYLSIISNRMNEIMKVMIVISTLFMPLSFIAGVYGMNFNTEVSHWNMPELNWQLGYPFSLALMGLTTIGLLVYFWRNKWLW